MTRSRESLQQRVRRRAGNRCEYCLSHQHYVMGILQIDHIWPVILGGADTEDNLCLACELCNQHKWKKTQGIDPQTGTNVRLYHPRQQKWNEHFRWSASGEEIIGLTPSGRATVTELKLNNELAIIVRRNWIQAGWHPPVVD